MSEKRRKRSRKCVSLATLFIFSLSLIPKPSPSFSSPFMAIAVLDFDYTGGEAKYQTLSKGISESLSTFLIKYAQGKIIVVERAQIEKAIKELGFQQGGFTDETTSLKVGKLTNATHVLLGNPGTLSIFLFLLRSKPTPVASCSAFPHLRIGDFAKYRV